MGQTKHPAGIVRDLFRRVYWLCSYQKRGSDCRLIRLLRIVSGNISVGRQGTCFGLRARTPARQCRRLVQRSCRPSGIGRKRCRWFVVGPCQSRCCVLLRCDLCYCGQRGIALYSRKTQPVRRLCLKCGLRLDSPRVSSFPISDLPICRMVKNATTSNRILLYVARLIIPKFCFICRPLSIGFMLNFRTVRSDMS
jgi:hypothetical protein